MNSIELPTLSLLEISMQEMDLNVLGIPLGGKKIVPTGEYFTLDSSTLNGGDILN